MNNLINHLKKEWYKYLLEIFVITIGILGAFMLNNWNKERIGLKMERAILNDLQPEIQNNLDQITEVIDRHERSVEDLRYILDAFKDSAKRVNDLELDEKVYEELIHEPS